MKLVSLPVVGERTAERLGRPAEPVLEKVEVRPEAESDIVSITATDRSALFAARLANAFAQEYVEFRRDADRSKIREAQRLVEQRIDSLPSTRRNGPRRRSLQERSEELGVLASLQTGNAEVVQRARPPTSPSQPRPVRNALLGGILGLILGVAVAFVLERLDRRLNDPDEIKELFGRPILAVIPESRAIRSASSPAFALPAREAEVFRMLRASLRYFGVDRDVRSVLITSAAPGDGKSTVAWNLAAAEAASGRRVLLIEADLHHPALDRALGLGRGLSDVLAGAETPKDATKKVSLDEDSTEPPTMDVMPAGAPPPNPADLIESGRMRSLIRSAEETYDLVVLDTPPTSVVSDAIPLVNQVSGVIVVARLGKTARDAGGHLRDQLENLGAPVLGVVVNGLDVRRGSAYGFAYRYQYERPPPRETSKEPRRSSDVRPSVARWPDEAAGDGAGRERRAAPTEQSAAIGEEPRERDGASGQATNSAAPSGALGRLRQLRRR